MKTFTLLLCFLFSAKAIGQTILFSESFDEAAGSTTGNSAEGISWSATCPNCGSGDYYEVNSGTFKGQDTNGLATWTSASISIPANTLYLELKLDYNGIPYAGSGNLETVAECPGRGGTPPVPPCTGKISDCENMSIGCYNCWDFLAYRADFNSGTEVQEDFLLGIDPVSDSSGSLRLVNCNIQGHTSVTISMLMAMWASSEHMSFDNVELIAYTSAEADAAGISIPSCSTPLPVTFSSFEAFAQNNSSILQWTTISETSSDYFSIERSIDGVIFEEITIQNTKAINGNSTVPLNYEFVDFAPSEVNYYRLKQVDIDGHYEYYHQIKKVDFINKQSAYIYPNPINRGQAVSISGEVREYELYTATGQLINRHRYYTPQTNIKVGTHLLAKGVYFIRINHEEALKLIVE